MQSHLLYTVGNSDITLYDAGGRKASRFKPFFEATREVAGAGFEPETGKKSCRLLRPVVLSEGRDSFTATHFELQPLDALWEWFGSNGERHLFRATLFATRQSIADGKDPGARARPYDSDTLHLAKLMAEYIAMRGWLPKGQITIEQINQNPSDYTAMGEWFRRYVGRSHKTLTAADRIYTQISCGTPAMYANLAHCLMPYGTTVIYISRTEQGSSAAEDRNYFREYLDGIQATAAAAMDGLAYGTVRQLLANSPLRNSAKLRTLTELGESLAGYDYEEAGKILASEQAQGIPQDIRRQLEGIGGDFWQKARAVADQIEFLECHGDTVQALVLVVGLADAIRTRLLEEHCRLRLEGMQRPARQAALAKALSQRGLDCGDSDKEDMRRILAWEAKSGGHDAGARNRLNSFLELSRLVQRLAEIRNATPYAHGIMGVRHGKSREYEAARAALRKILETEGRQNVFEQVNVALVKGMD